MMAGVASFQVFFVVVVTLLLLLSFQGTEADVHVQPVWVTAADDLGQPIKPSTFKGKD